MSSSTTSISLTNSAVKRIQTLLPEQISNYFRVYVTGGGCSGFQYGFKFDENPEGDDDIITLADLLYCWILFHIHIFMGLH